MELSFTQKKSLRKSFGKLVETLSIPNLIEVQKNSYNEFLQSKSLKDQMNELSKGIEKVFKSIFPIEDGTDKSTLDLLKIFVIHLFLYERIGFTLGVFHGRDFFSL